MARKGGQATRSTCGSGEDQQVTEIKPSTGGTHNRKQGGGVAKKEPRCAQQLDANAKIRSNSPFDLSATGLPGAAVKYLLQEPPWPERVGKLRARAARGLGANAWAKVHVVSLKAH